MDSSGALVEFHAVPPQRTPGQPVRSEPAGREPAGGRDRLAGRLRRRALAARSIHAGDARVDAARRHRHPRRLDRHPPGAGRDAAAPRGRQLRRPPGVRADGRAVDQAVARSASRIEVHRAARPGPVPGVPDPDADRGLRPPGATQHGARPRRPAGRLARGRGAGRAERRGAGPSRRITCPTIPSSRTRSSTRSAGRCCRPASCGSPISASSRGSGVTGRPASSRGAGCWRAPSAIRSSAATC